MTSVVIVCPTAVERRALLARHPRLAHLRVEVCGPGPSAIRRWSATIAPRSTVILAGVAGGLVEDAAVGVARAVREVWHSDGKVAHVPIVPSGATWRVAGADHLVGSASAKRSLAARSGAAIVDMESHAFIAEATRHAWRCGIVRGVSDACTDELPQEIEFLVDHQGRTRVIAATALLVRRPHLVSTFRLLARRTDDAMSAVGAVVVAMLESERAL